MGKVPPPDLAHEFVSSLLSADAFYALLGVALGFVAAGIFEVLRARREARSRWESRSYEVIVAYVDSVKRQSNVSNRVAAHRWRGLDPSPLSPRKGRTLLARYSEDRAARFESLQFSEPRKVIAAARKWHDVVMRMHAVAYLNNPMTRSEFEALRAAAADRRRDFWNAVRKSYRVRGQLRPLDEDPPWYFYRQR
jgi:hypothetical protein